MSKNNKYKPGPSDFLDYSEGKLKGRKRNAFERYLEQNLFDAEAAEGFSMVSQEEAEQDLAVVGKKIQGRINRKRRIGWYSAAAAIVSILAISTIFFNVDRTSLDRPESIPEISKGYEQKTEKKEARRDMDILENEEVKDVEEGPEQTVTEEMKTEGAAQISDLQEEFSPQLSAGADADVDEIVVEAVAREVVSSENAEEDMLDFAMDMEAEERMEEKIEQVTAPAQPVTAGRAKSSAKRMAMEKEETEASAVKGVIISADDSTPIPGATIMLKGTSVGTVADSKGNFKLNLEETDENKIVASFIGMESEEMDVLAGSNVEIVMNESSQSLDEVVVVGYGSNRRYDQTGSVQSVENTIIGAEPEFGLSDYNDYIDNELIFPISEYDMSRAVVVVKFIVLPNKRPYNIQIVRSPAQAFSNEVQRVIFSGSDWKPAMKNGEYVEDEVSLRIVFKEAHKR